MDTFISFGFYITYVLLFIAILALIIFPLYFMATNLQKAKGGLLGLVGLLTIFAVAVIISPADQGGFYTQFNIGPSISRFIGGGIVGFYFLLGAAIISAVYSELAKWFK